MTAFVDAAAQLLDELGLVLPGGLEVLLDADALGLEAHHGVLDPLAQVVVHEHLGRVLVDQLGEGVGGPLEHELAHLGEPHALHLVALGVAERLGRLEVGVLADPLVGELGQRRAPAPS